MFFKVGARRPGGSAARFHFGTLRREIPFIPQTTAGTWLGPVVGADVPGGPPPARDVRQSDLVRGAGRARGTRAPTNVRGLMHQGQRVWGGGVGGVGTAATSAALPHDAARFHFGTHVFPHPATRCCKMRFHRVIILKAVVPRGGFDTCGLPRGCLGGPGAARSGCVPGSCPSRACRDLHSRAPPSSPENRDKSILNTRRPPPGRTRINVLVFPVGARVPQSCQASLMHDANSAVPSPHTISGLHQIGSSWPVRHLQLA